MKATILLATLKRDGLSNTRTLSEFLAGRMERAGVDVSIVTLVERNVPPGTYSDMGDGDEWPAILRQLLDSDLIVFATPVWWNNQSSLMQRVIERLDELHDEIMEGRPSRLEGKVAGIVVTGDSDGAQTIIANLCNFSIALGMVVPPYGSLTVLHEKQAKGKDTPREELLAMYEKDYAKTADTMIAGMQRLAGAGKRAGKPDS